MDGRTGGGGTGRHVKIIHSGREKTSLKPKLVKSFTEICLKIFKISSVLKTLSSGSSASPVALSFFQLPTNFNPSLRIVGCVLPQPPLDTS